MKEIRAFFGNYWQRILFYLGLVAIATVFVLLFSISTSPVYWDYYTYGGPTDGGDSLHFQTDGVNWLYGKVPYRDFFDHKGPIIFLVNMLGFWLGGGTRYGIIVLQIISLAVTLSFIWKISQLAKRSSLWGAICIILTLIFMTASYNVGNSVQEYNLAFITPAIYLLAKYFYDKKQTKHNPKWAFVYGLGIGSCLLLQVTHMIPICAGILAVSIILIKQKEWRNLWQNVLYGAIGILILWLPFAFYFLINGAFGDFIYCSIVFNFGYAANIGSWLHSANASAVQFLLTVYIPFFCLIGAVVLAYVRKKIAYAGVLLLCLILETYLFFSGQLFAQYSLPFLFQIVLFLNEIILFQYGRDDVKHVLYIGMISLMVLLAYNQFSLRSQQLIEQYNAVRASAIAEPDYDQLIKRNLDTLKQTTFSIYDGGLGLKGGYVRFGLVPHNRFFVIQTWCALFTDKIRLETHDDFRNNRAEYILSAPVYVFNEDVGIRDVIEEYYEPVDHEGEYILYRLKEA